MKTDYQTLRVEMHGAHVLIVTLNRPEVANALNTQMGRDLLDLWTGLIAEPGAVRAAILTGAGGRVFCAGGDLKERNGMTKAQWEAQHEIFERQYWALLDCPVPVIAAVNGPAYGAGCDLACMCDVRIASERAIFAESFIKVGIVPGDGGAWLLPRVVGRSKAAEMSFTGEMLDAGQALDCGLVSRVVPAEQLLDAARELAGRIAANPGPTLRLTKRLLREGEHQRLDSLLQLSASFQALAHKTPQHR